MNLNHMMFDVVAAGETKAVKGKQGAEHHAKRLSKSGDSLVCVRTTEGVTVSEWSHGKKLR